MAANPSDRKPRGTPVDALKPDLILRKSSVMTIRLEVPTAMLPKFFIGAQISVEGHDAQIEKMEALQSVSPGVMDTWLELTLLIL
jgi:hypothetical protein